MANPTSICPARIWLETVVTAIKPLEQNRLMIWTGTESGNPAASIAARAKYAASGVRTVPTQTSPTASGSTFEREITC